MQYCIAPPEIRRRDRRQYRCRVVPGKSWRRYRAASDRPRRLGKHHRPSLSHRARDGDHGANRSDPVLRRGAAHGPPSERVGEALDLAPVEVPVGSKRGVPRRVALTKDVDLARLDNTRG